MKQRAIVPSRSTHTDVTPPLHCPVRIRTKVAVTSWKLTT